MRKQCASFDLCIFITLFQKSRPLCYQKFTQFFLNSNFNLLIDHYLGGLKFGILKMMRIFLGPLWLRGISGISTQGSLINPEVASVRWLGAGAARHLSILLNSLQSLPFPRSSFMYVCIDFHVIQINYRKKTHSKFKSHSMVVHPWSIMSKFTDHRVLFAI